MGKRDHLNVFGNDYKTHDGTGVRDYIHVVDLARGHVKAIDYCLKIKGTDVINLEPESATVCLILSTLLKRLTELKFRM